jgi:hypothetical protein
MGLLPPLKRVRSPTSNLPQEVGEKKAKFGGLPRGANPQISHLFLLYAKGKGEGGNTCPEQMQGP